MDFHHIGIATADIQKTTESYLALGFTAGDVIFDPIQNVNISFLQKEMHPLIELVSPVDEKSPVFDIIKKNGTMPYHLCYEIDDLEESIKQFKGKRFLQVSKPAPAIAFQNRRICFMYNRHIGLLELLEK